MVARIPLIVNPDAAQIQELPVGDTIDFPVVTAIADGTIAANAPVILTSDGKVKAIEYVAESNPSTLAARTTTWLTGSATEAVARLHGGTFMKGPGSGWEDNVIVTAWQLKSSTGSLDQRLYIKSGTLSGTTITWASNRVDTTETVSNVAIASDGISKGLLLYTLGTQVRVRTFYVPNSNNANLNITWGDLNSMHSSNTTKEGNVCYLGNNGSSDYFAVSYIHGSTGTETCLKIIKHDGPNNIAIGPQTQIYSSTDGATTDPHTTTHIFPISHDKFIVQIGELNGNVSMHVCTRGVFGNSNGTDVHIGQAYTSKELGMTGGLTGNPSTQLTDPVFLHNDHYNGAVYDTINEKFIVWHTKAHGNATTEGTVRVYNIDGESINFQFESRFVTDGVDYTHFSAYPTVQVTDIGQIVITFNLNTNKHGKRVVGSYNHDRTQIFWNQNGWTSWGSNADTWSSEDTRYVQQVKADNGKIINLYSNGDGGSYNTSGKAVVFQTATTTLTANNFLGFSSAAYSDGDAARIKVVGNTVTTTGGKTIGEKYYVRDDGLLVTSATNYTRNLKDVLAGKAIAASKILITPV